MKSSTATSVQSSMEMGGDRADVLGEDVCLFDADHQVKLSAGLGKTADEFLEGSLGVCCQGGIISK